MISRTKRRRRPSLRSTVFNGRIQSLVKLDLSFLNMHVLNVERGKIRCVLVPLSSPPFTFCFLSRLDCFVRSLPFFILLASLPIFYQYSRLLFLSISVFVPVNRTRSHSSRNASLLPAFLDPALPLQRIKMRFSLSLFHPSFSLVSISYLVSRTPLFTFSPFSHPSLSVRVGIKSPLGE